MPRRMRPATPGDARAMASVYFSAFQDNSVATTCFPQASQACRDFLSTSFAEEIKDPRCQWLVVVTDSDHSEESDQIIACAKWVRPSQDGEPNVTPPPPSDIWPKDGNPAFANHFFGSLAKKHAEIMGGTRHWYLELIVCRKEHHGTGAATPLMRWGCQKADEEEKVVFLESMPAAKAVYEKYGFQAVYSMNFEVPNSGVATQTFMLRKGNAIADSDAVMARIGELRKAEAAQLA
ncbi:hypothetical protein CCHL11_04605 [Colletotrichum chlorophyti]|uniref:N-acetyltransferase domain-containing protein n=1 Tax=Colletotrichum chlorophyti TaxID=708187 RepID=A0A1Q8RRN7_9PEZI|nr:hypothetical protein CCHL11_04605 [Colletotrichum chlorophyti]